MGPVSLQGYKWHGTSMCARIEVAWDQLVCKDISGMGPVCVLEWKWHGTS